MEATQSGAGGHGARGRWTTDERLHYRFPILQLGLAVTLATEAEPALTIPGRLIDLSTGGCYLAAPRDLGLTPGSACRVGLPVTPDGLTTYLATVVRIERRGSAQPGVALGLCLRHHSLEAQRQLLYWLATLRVQTWHASLHGQPDPTDPPDIWRDLAAADPAESAAVAAADAAESAAVFAADAAESAGGSVDMESEPAGAGLAPDAVPPARHTPRSADPSRFVVLEESAEPDGAACLDEDSAEPPPPSPPPQRHFTPPAGFTNLAARPADMWRASQQGRHDPADLPDAGIARAAADPVGLAAPFLETEVAGAGLTPNAVPPARHMPRSADPSRFVVPEESDEPDGAACLGEDSAKPSPPSPPSRQHFTPPDGFIRL